MKGAFNKSWYYLDSRLIPVWQGLLTNICIRLSDNFPFGTDSPYICCKGTEIDKLAGRKLQRESSTLSTSSIPVSKPTEVFKVGSLPLLPLFIVCTPSVYCLVSLCLLSLLPLFIVSTPSVYCLYSLCLLSLLPSYCLFSTTYCIDSSVYCLYSLSKLPLPP